MTEPLIDRVEAAINAATADADVTISLYHATSAPVGRCARQVLRSAEKAREELAMLREEKPSRWGSPISWFYLCRLAKEYGVEIGD